MRTLFLALIFCLLSAVSFSKNMGVEWDANTEEDMKEYRVYQVMLNGNYALVGIVTHPETKWMMDLVPAWYTFVVTAVNTGDYESEYSNAVSTPPAPGAVEGFSFRRE